MGDLSGFVDAVGRVLGGTRDSLGPGVSRDLWSSRQVFSSTGSGSGRAATAMRDVHSELMRRNSALGVADARMVGVANAAAQSHREHVMRLDRVIAGAGSDVAALGPSTNTQAGSRRLVDALTNRLSEGKAAYGDAIHDGKTHADNIGSATDRYRELLGGQGTKPTAAPLTPRALGGIGSLPTPRGATSPLAGMASSVMPAIGSVAPALLSVPATVLKAPMNILGPVLSGLGGLGQPAASGSGTTVGPHNIPGKLGQLAGSRDQVRDAIVRRAMSNLGEPYVYGANGPNAWDCSSLVQDAYKAAGVNLPRTTYDMVHLGHTVGRGELKAGDMIFANWRNGRPEHMMMAISPDRVIEAPNSHEVVKIRDVPVGKIVIRRVLPD